ncbi:MAG: DNA polymerase III subunit [Thermoguttaceae bacterium]|jgi:DNA polymerase-3 subunit delta'
MTWHGIRGHDGLVEQFRRALARQRLASSFLFTGPSGIGKRLFALKLAQAMLCQTRPEQALDPCTTCHACTLVAAGNHPDLEVIEKPRDKAFLPVELFLGDREHRGREGLCHRIALKPMMGGRKIAVIDQADDLNAEGANCLLKTLEEPPPRSVLILVGTSPARQLPTIRSRCQLVRFRPLEPEVVAELLLEQGVVKDPVEARRLAEHAEGSLSQAAALADPELWTFRRALVERLAEPVLASVALAQAVQTFVDAAGKDAAPRRARLRQVAAFAADFYRRLLHAESGAVVPGDDDLGRLVRRAALSRPGHAAALDRCLEAAAQIDRNANQATFIEAWLDDLARLASAP